MSEPTLSRPATGAAERRLRAVCDLSMATVREEGGRHEYDGRVQDLSAEGVKAGLARLAPEGGERLPDRWEEAHLAAFENGLRFAFHELELHRRDPWLHLANLDLSVYEREYAPLADRLAARHRHLANWPDAVDMAVTTLDRVSAPAAAALLGAARGLADGLQGEDRTTEAARRAHQRLLTHLVRAAEEGDPDASLGAQGLAGLMGAAEGVELDLSRLADRAEEERRRLTDMLGEACALIDPARRPAELVPELLADHPTADRVIAEATAVTAEAIAFTRAHRLTPDLDGECRVGPAPESRRWVKAMLTWAAPNESDAPSRYCVTPPDPSWPADRVEEWLTIFSATTLPAITVHEVAPGHFAHGRALRRVAGPVRRTLLSQTFMEGWAHYAEEVCLEEGFRSGDPRFAVGVALEGLCRVVRLTCAIGLHTGAFDVAEATRRFMADALLPRATAESEAHRGTFDATYGRYTWGKLAMMDLRERARAAAGPAFSLERFHRSVLALGCPPLAVLPAVFEE
ncbi:DUF885 family protein [Kitasatospora brasiliensis]|uniref:DUF885 family protein n=1 Tax=Kitasatospora brasiliensis TaxID=3058040 RepID=UPI00292D2060|nr:DUF885 family protein [Kitasatospora sp. K002]